MTALPTHREIIINQPEIRLYLPFSGWFVSKRTSVWIQINRKMVTTIWFRVDLIRFQKYFSVCSLSVSWGSKTPPPLQHPNTSRQNATEGFKAFCREAWPSKKEKKKTTDKKKIPAWPQSGIVNYSRHENKKKYKKRYKKKNILRDFFAVRATWLSHLKEYA